MNNRKPSSATSNVNSNTSSSSGSSPSSGASASSFDSSSQPALSPSEAEFRRLHLALVRQLPGLAPGWWRRVKAAVRAGKPAALQFLAAEARSRLDHEDRRRQGAVLRVLMTVLGLMIPSLVERAGRSTSNSAANYERSSDPRFGAEANAQPSTPSDSKVEPRPRKAPQSKTQRQQQSTDFSEEAAHDES